MIGLAGCREQPEYILFMCEIKLNLRHEVLLPGHVNSGLVLPRGPRHSLAERASRDKDKVIVNLIIRDRSPRMGVIKPDDV